MKDSKIGWTHHTFNPWWGCARVAPECKNCYAATFAKRTGNTGLWNAGERQFRTFGDKHWNQPLKWDEAAAKAGERHRVFCASMADVFDRQAPESELRRLALLIDATPSLDWLLLSKRIKELDPEFQRPNVWLGATCGHSKSLPNVRAMMERTAAVRFISAEPLLEDITEALSPADDYTLEDQFEGVDWVIIGGESGPGARPFDLAWARSLIGLCRDLGAAVFVKQFGARPVNNGVPLKLRDRKGEDWSEWPEDLRIREFPKGAGNAD